MSRQLSQLWEGAAQRAEPDVPGRGGRAAASALSRCSALLAQLLVLGVAELSSASAPEQL